jgi:type II secretory pathway component GspD/PulD (secretin)
MTRSSPALAAVFLVLLPIGGCGLPIEETVGSIFSKPVSVAAAPPPLASLEDRPSPYRYPDFVGDDGSVTRTMWLPPGSGASVKKALSTLPEYKAEGLTVIDEGGPALTDPNRDAAGLKGWAAQTGVEAIVLRGPLDKVDACANLIERFLNSVPQILIEARVVEVLESDEFGLGFDWFTLNRDDFSLDPVDYLSPLSATYSPFNRGLAGTGLPSLPGVQQAGVLPNLLLDLGTIVGDLQVDLLIAALSQMTKIDVVNAPNVATLSGHVATIRAGEEIPFFELALNSGGNPSVTTKFKEVDVNLQVLPHVVGKDRVRLTVSLAVRNVTGLSTVETAGTTVTNPIISNRSVTNTMMVKDGSTVVLGGLLTTQEIEVEERVPGLGSIPVLGFLFTNLHTRESRSNLLFFLRPRILNPAGTRDVDIILPPEDGESIGPSPDVIVPPAPEPEKGR